MNKWVKLFNDVSATGPFNVSLGHVTTYHHSKSLFLGRLYTLPFVQYISRRRAGSHVGPHLITVHDE